ncbi:MULTISPECIES: restriction endonuclease subunit S [Lactococcus]|uniref:restriction endonuclease subunit S n=1 Tax=Lactococcus TaxID=1357 RepID=UPI0024A69B28|nr:MULTISPECIES: restriction endonuclease subunit S [Lactococcus]MDT2559256.1 restriction endonuclease subunit S [Lactococcus petauri]
MAKIDDSVKKKVPELRFPGFTDDWEERKLSDIVVRLTKSSNNNQLPKVEFEDIIAGEGRLNKDISRKFDDRKGTLFEPDNILYGKLRPYLKNWLFSDFKGIALGDFWVFKSKNSEPKFVYSLIQADNYQRVANDTSGTKMPRSDWKKVSSSNFSIPTSLEEQQKIGSFFKQLDNTIALHQRKLDLLKEQKKGYLQKMFPKNGEKVPELRFAGFADDWEEHKLKDVVEKQIKGKAQFEKLAQGDVEYLDTSRLNGGQAILTNGLKDVTLDDILILWDGSKAGTVYHGFEGALGSTLKAYRTSANSKFVYQYLKRHQDNIYNNYRTPNIPHVQKDFLNVFTISVPGSDEQAKIGSFFKKLDDTIALHQRKLDLLKEQKKGFLQKMFV